MALQDRLPFSSRRGRLLVISAALIGALATIALVLVVREVADGAAQAGDGRASEALGPSIRYYISPTPRPTATPVPTPTPKPKPVPSGFVPSRIMIPKFGVEAPIVVLGVDSSGVMETPSGPWEAAWYDFTGKAGGPGNAVFAGHVDANYTGDPGPAVFYHLKDLQEGDHIEVLAGGTLYRYAVTSKWSISESSGDLGPVVGRTPMQSVTLITCGGDSGSLYDLRLVVRAVRIL